MRESRRHLLVVLALIAAGVFSGCASAPPATAPSPAPWSGAKLRGADVPAVYVAEWRKAENREACAPLAFATVEHRNAAPRRANFGGGWAVAYDLPKLRSAFGIAGTGLLPGDDNPSDDYQWPNNRRWADGSRVGYGPEGGTGPNQLAYLRIPGQKCLYNVWSRVSVEHLEQLLESLRFVETE